MKKERDTTIDIGKGLCIYLMVLGHCLFYGNVHHIIYLFHMPFFFFVSGFFLKVNSDWSVFFVQKTKRLLLPLGIYWIFATIIKVLENILGKHQIEFVFADIGPLWFLISLWTIFMLSYITIKLTKYVKWIWGGIIILPLIGYLLVSQNIRCPLYLVQSLIMFPMFLLGYICYNISLPWKRNNTETVYSILASNRIFVLIFSFVALCSYIYVPFGNLDLSSLQLPSAFSLYTAALFGIILVFTVAKMLSKCLLLKNMLTIMGSKSMHILGFHFPILTTVYLVAIPIVIRFEKLFGLPLMTGEDIKFNTPWLAIVMSVLVTYVSLNVGKYLEHRYPILFGVIKKNKIDD